jgi:CelD/BcsL family acetyltransferase involved in cellulose biosynthesis
VGYRTALLRADDIDEGFAAAWDSLPEGRGIQSDFYDTHAWFASWLTGFRGGARSVRIAAVLDGDRPLAVLPMTGRGRHAVIAGSEVRTRARPVLGTEAPEADVLGALAETVGQAGIRTLHLHRLPSRDPATPALIRALSAVGYDVRTIERSCDRLASVDGGWAGHSRRFKSFAQYAKRFSGKITPLWPLTMQEYGTGPDRPVAEGFAIYLEIQARSWKGAMPAEVVAQRRQLLAAAESRGWARLYVLRIADVAVAAHVWFRIGDVATWFSTAYDQSLAVLSPGTLVQWWSQERLMQSDPPRLMDYLPGANPQKERLAPETPPLLLADAARRTLVSGVTLPARLESRRVKHAVRQRVRAQLRRRAETARASGGHIRAVTVTPGIELPAVPLEVNPAVTRYLAAAAGAQSARAATESWAGSDPWWRVGEGAPVALARLTAGGEMAELVRLAEHVEAESVAAALAVAAGRPVTFAVEDPRGMPGEALRVRIPSIPWPQSWNAERALAGTRRGA